MAGSTSLAPVSIFRNFLFQNQLYPSNSGYESNATIHPSPPNLTAVSRLHPVAVQCGVYLGAVAQYAAGAFSQHLDQRT